ncbi:uncharacterized protein EKO05_0002557 [Ascochyta rabiei]|uniref:uncharacterized protein n=1 Tax=Didymella rabiei TaxID=5454 RepID=UPI00220F9A1C|nr:uncharacterized protein EKO05_0002557 [Ascochyta rabiei]UPX11979.1 hypothetical protein EKO05_0002557 [Ascochyta rabiei]
MMPPEQGHPPRPPRRSSSHTAAAREPAPSESSSGPSSHLHPHRPRPHPHGAVAEQFAPQPRDAYGGETWVDFLREAPPARPRPHLTPTSTTPTTDPVPASSSSPPLPLPLPSRLPTDASSPSSSADRKRRLTTADSPMRRPSSTRPHSASHHGSSSNPLVLDASPPPASASAPALERPLPPPPSYAAPSTTPSPFRRESDLVLPAWQPDADVADCPVCNRHFTFLFRKHHCRKCGRVVCSQCSPHRITIPRQFIVHPPSDAANSLIDLSGDDDANPMSNFGPFRNPALGGGEEVRVCNPCVPDPNYSLPPQYPSPATHAHGQPPPPATRPDYIPGAAPPYQRSHPSSSSLHVAPRPASQRSQTQPSRDPFSTRRVSYHDPSRPEDRWPSPLPTLGHVYPSLTRQNDHTLASSRPPTGSTYLPQAPQQRAGSGSSSVRAGDRFPRQFFVPTPQPPAIQQLNPRPRRQIAEEDECPICGGELPAKGPDGDDSARSQHIEECIALHSSSPAPNSAATRPQAQTSASLPTTRTRGMSSAGNAEGAGSSSHRHSHAARGMFPYTATEKDCIDENGDDAECVICFEEFQPGDKMARLVCWCKFHETCIKQWWKMKGRGACPTHQLHEE